MKDADILYAFFVTLQADELSAREILVLAAPFGITETNVRSALSRMHARDVIAVRKQGRTAFYRRGGRGRRIGANVARHFHEPDWSGWDGTYWAAAFSQPDSKIRHRLQKKLLAYRFRALYPGVWIRPRHPVEKIEETFADFLGRNGFDLLCGDFVKEPSRERIAGLYGLHRTGKDLRTMLRTVRRSGAAVSSLSPKAAFVHWLRTGDSIVKTLMSDPLLPPSLLPPRWPGTELRRAFKRWNALCEKRSAPFVREALHPRKRGGK
ncbi:MAG: PaaX family transcriptional regulator C-terminal domain-containing protein [Anaerolineales bacterium]